MGFANPRPPETPVSSISPLLLLNTQSPMAHNFTTSIFRKSQEEKMLIQLSQPPTQQGRRSHHLRTTQHRRRNWFSFQVSILSSLLNSLILIKYNCATISLNHKEIRPNFQLLFIMIKTLCGDSVFSRYVR